MSEDLTRQYDLTGVETKEDLLEYIEQRVDSIMDDHGFYDDDNEVETDIANFVFEFLQQRNRLTYCDTCEQWYVTRLNPEGCPYIDRPEHEENGDE